MRYIDADKFAKQVYEVAYPIIHDTNSHERGLTLMDIAKLLDDQQIADVVEVVRCKDCRWYERDIFDREAGVCFNPNKCTKTLGFEVLNEDYCSYGERADE